MSAIESAAERRQRLHAVLACPRLLVCPCARHRHAGEVVVMPLVGPAAGTLVAAEVALVKRLVAHGVPVAVGWE